MLDNETYVSLTNLKTYPFNDMQSKSVMVYQRNKPQLNFVPSIVLCEYFYWIINQQSYGGHLVAGVPARAIHLNSRDNGTLA